MLVTPQRCGTTWLVAFAPASVAGADPARTARSVVLAAPVRMSVAIQALVAGLAVGVVYGLVEFGFAIVHRLAAVLPLAHGDLVVGAVFTAVLAVVGATSVALELRPGAAFVFVAVALVGIPTGRVVLAAFAFAGALAGLARVLVAPGRAVALDAGVILGLKGAAAAPLGGLGSLRAHSSAA